MASTPSAATCKTMDILVSRKVSCVRRTSPGLSSTRRTCMGLPFPPAAFMISSRYPPGRSESWNPAPPDVQPKEARRLISCSCDLFVRRQLGLCQPEIIDALHQSFERLQLHRLAQVAIRLKTIAFRDIPFRI